MLLTIACSYPVAAQVFIAFHVQVISDQVQCILPSRRSGTCYLPWNRMLSASQCLLCGRVGICEAPNEDAIINMRVLVVCFMLGAEVTAC
jgi:hypothetical protein